MYYTCQYKSPIGLLTLASDGAHLTGLWIEGQKHFGRNHDDPVIQPELPLFRIVTAWLDQYFAGCPVSSTRIPLKPTGTPFELIVWDALSSIPTGQTVTYGQIARQLGKPGATQAVGAAVGRNPISIIIPCHRVLGSNGQLTGYVGGLERKVWLLHHEGIASLPEQERILSGFPL